MRIVAYKLIPILHGVNIQRRNVTVTYTRSENKTQYVEDFPTEKRH